MKGGTTVTTKGKLLALLEDNKETFFSGEEIARTLQISRAAVWKAVNALREDGYTIDAVTNKGYRLSPDSDILSPQGIRKFLKPEYKNLDLTVLPTAPSTNALVREKANQGCPEGCVIVACGQTAGRGRYGRQFFSPVDTGVYLSLLLRPTAYSPQQATCLTAAAAAAMCQAIESVTGQQPGIKWVNDIFLHGKKVCGILTEAAVNLETGSLDYMVLGAGVNLYPPLEGFPEEIQSIAGSVLEHRTPEAKNRLAGEFLNRFWDFYTHPERKAYLEDYRARSLAIGRNVTVLSNGQAVSAYAYGIDDDFRLLVRYGSGETEALSYGEIRIQLGEDTP